MNRRFFLELCAAALVLPKETAQACGGEWTKPAHYDDWYGEAAYGEQEHLAAAKLLVARLKSGAKTDDIAEEITNLYPKSKLEDIDQIFYDVSTPALHGNRYELGNFTEQFDTGKEEPFIPGRGYGKYTPAPMNVLKGRIGGLQMKRIATQLGLSGDYFAQPMGPMRADRTNSPRDYGCSP